MNVLRALPTCSLCFLLHISFFLFHCRLGRKLDSWRHPPPHLTLHSYATGNGLILFPQIQNWGQGWVGPTTERVSNSQGIRPCYAGMASGSQTLCIEPMSNKEETLGTTQPFHLGSSTDVSLQSPSLTLNDSPASE